MQESPENVNWEDILPKATCLRFNSVSGAWEVVGNRLFGPKGISEYYGGSLGFLPSGEPIVGIRDIGHGHVVKVMRLNASTWQYMQPVQLTPGAGGVSMPFGMLLALRGQWPTCRLGIGLTKRGRTTCSATTTPPPGTSWAGRPSTCMSSPRLD